MFDLKKLNPAEVMEAGQIAIEVLKFLDGMLGTHTQVTAIAAIVTSVFQVLREYRDGTVSAETVRDEMKRLQTEFAVNDAAADAALKKKFGQGDEPS